MSDFPQLNTKFSSELGGGYKNMNKNWMTPILLYRGREGGRERRRQENIFEKTIVSWN